MINFEYIYSHLSEQFYSHQAVYKYPNVKLLILNDCLATELGLDLVGNSEQESLKLF